MYWKFCWKVLSFILISALFVAGGITIYKAGYAQGAVDGTSTLAVDTNIPAPYQWLYYPSLLLLPFTGLLLLSIFMFVFFGGFRHHIRYHLGKSTSMPGPEEIKQYWHSIHHNYHRPRNCWNAKENDQEESGRINNPDTREENLNSIS